MRGIKKNGGVVLVALNDSFRSIQALPKSEWDNHDRRQLEGIRDILEANREDLNSYFIDRIEDIERMLAR